MTAILFNLWKGRDGQAALIVGCGCLLLTALIGLLAPGAFFFAYLSAIVLWLGVPLGAGAFLLLHFLVGGRWGWPLRPVLGGMSRTTPLAAALFLPILAGLSRLYPWIGEKRAAEIVHAKAFYLNKTFFIDRTLGYLMLWTLGAFLIARVLRGGSDNAAEAGGSFAPRLGAIGLILYVLTVSFAGVDWIASLEPVWFSSIFGLYVMIGQVVAALSLAIILQKISERDRSNPSAAVVGARQDAGTLLLTVVVLHAYFAFSQFLIIWNGNIVNEIGWFTTRIRGGWGFVALAMILFHFVIPFAALLSRQVKRDEQALVGIAVVLLFACFVDTVWMVIPSYGGSSILSLFLAATSTVGIGGVWYWMFERLRGERSATPS